MAIRFYNAFRIIVLLLFSQFFFSSVVFSKSLSPEPDPWSFISKSTCGVDRFIEKHPKADGRGVIICILDTGVDMGIPGLLTTSTGQQKVIDVHDFSGGGDIHTTPAVFKIENDLPVVSDSAGSLSLTGVDTFDIQENDSTLEIGIFKEKYFQNSDFRDFDDDGKCKSEFGFVIFSTDTGYVAIIDTDNDGDLSNEKPIQNYNRHFQTFVFSKEPDSKASLPNCAINIFPESHKVVFHFDDSSHGTHVAGIAAGHNIYAGDDEETYNGIAPGAEIISCKISKGNIGDLTTSGSIVRAFNFAAELSKLQPKPVVINMSFGIPSVIEGHAQIETYIDSLIKNHPKLYVCLSNGNEGPGLSSTGLPASANYAISVGALLNKDIAQNTFGSQQQSNQIWDFSSRGGEVPKPDVVAPGSAHSTVPAYAYRTISSGTSMASPYVAGSVALLLSALRQEDSLGFANNHYPQRIIKTALKTSAKPLRGYGSLDYGSGLIDVAKTYETLTSFKKSGFTSDLVDYEIKTLAPNLGSDIFSTAAFVRYGSLEDIEYKKVFYVSVDFLDSLQKHEKSDFFRLYQLSSNQRWLKTLQSTFFLKGESQKPISVLYNKKLLRKPGLYHGVITAKATSKNKALRLRKYRSKEVEFELHNTIIVPYTFSKEDENTVQIKRQTIKSGELKRYFFAIPHYASSFRVKLISRQKNSPNISGTIVNPEGKVVGFIPPLTDDEYFTDEYLADENLQPGIYEVVIDADHFAKLKTFNYELEATIESLDLVYNGNYNNNVAFRVTNSGLHKIYGAVTGRYEGFTKTWSDSIYSPQIYRKPIRLYSNANSTSLKFRISKEDYNKNTDAFIEVVDSSGNKLTSKTLDSTEEELFFYHPDKTNDSLNVFLEIHYGFTFTDRKDAIAFNIEETHHIKSNILECRPGAFTLYPYTPQTVYMDMPFSEKIPKGFKRKGSIRFEETSKGIFQSKLTFYIDD